MLIMVGNKLDSSCWSSSGVAQKQPILNTKFKFKSFPSYYLLKDIALLERVQRRATKFILSDYTSDYKTRLIQLGLTTTNAGTPTKLQILCFLLNPSTIQQINLMFCHWNFVPENLVPEEQNFSENLVPAWNNFF